MESNTQGSSSGCKVRFFGMVAGGIVGVFVGLLIGPFLASLRGISSLEGADGMFTMFGVVPLCIMIGAVVGLLISSRKEPSSRA